MANSPASSDGSSSDLSSDGDDVTDGNYDPSHEIVLLPPSAIFTTPSKRVNTLTSVDPVIKEEIDKITCGTPGLSMKRCVIENIEEVNAVQYCHILARATKDSVISALEYSWGLRNGHLNVDSRFNIFRINSRLHHAFDRGNWVLIPSRRVLRAYASHGQRGLTDNNFMELVKPKNGIFEYVFVPLGDAMKSMPIHRQVDSEIRPGIPKATDFQHHAYPFNTLPKIKSHVHPRFVICNTAQKLLIKGYTVGHEYQTEFVYIHDIYRAWTTSPPSSSESDKSDNDDNDPPRGFEGRESEHSYRTRSARWNASPDDDDMEEKGRPFKRTRSRLNESDASVTWVHSVDIGNAPIESTFEKKLRIANWAKEVAAIDHIAQTTSSILPIQSEDFTSLTILRRSLSALLYYILGTPPHRTKPEGKEAEHFVQSQDRLKVTHI